MDFNKYQEEARKTRKESADFVYALVGLSAEVGELQSLYAKSRRDGTFTHVDVCAKELGDILWFIAALADDFGIRLDDVAQGNLAKLASRQARGVIGGSGDDR